MFLPKRLLWFEFLSLNYNFMIEHCFDNENKNFILKLMPFNVSISIPIEVDVQKMQSKAEYELIKVWEKTYPLERAKFRKFIFDKVLKEECSALRA